MKSILQGFRLSTSRPIRLPPIWPNFELVWPCTSLFFWIPNLWVILNIVELSESGCSINLPRCLSPKPPWNRYYLPWRRIIPQTCIYAYLAVVIIFDLIIVIGQRQFAAMHAWLLVPILDRWLTSISVSAIPKQPTTQLVAHRWASDTMGAHSHFLSFSFFFSFFLFLSELDGAPIRGIPENPISTGGLRPMPLILR